LGASSCDRHRYNQRRRLNRTIVHTYSSPSFQGVSWAIACPVICCPASVPGGGKRADALAQGGGGISSSARSTMRPRHMDCIRSDQRPSQRFIRCIWHNPRDSSIGSARWTGSGQTPRPLNQGRPNTQTGTGARSGSDNVELIYPDTIIYLYFCLCQLVQ